MFCTYCNFKNNPVNKFCESCGKPLHTTDLSPVAPKVAGVIAGRNGFPRNWLLLPVLLIIVVVGSIALWYSFRESQYGTSGMSLQSVQPPISDITPDDVDEPNWCGSCTTAQKSQMLNSFVGKRILWTENVSDVIDGEVHVMASLNRYVIVGLPSSAVNSLRVGQEITFEGVLQHHSSGNSHWWTVTNAKIVN